MKNNLFQGIDETDIKHYKICIVGLGYVGLPLAYAFSMRGYTVIGFDINKKRIGELLSGYDRTAELTNDQMAEMNAKIEYSSEIEDAGSSNIYIVTVPTPIDASNKPDLEPLVSASSAIGRVLSEGDIVVFESTVYPGVTEDICVPALEASSTMKFNEDFYCGYSPERINPGDKQNTLTNIKKVTSGSTPEIAVKIDELYKTIIAAGTHSCSSIKVAEASKVIENTQRDVNIALINELSLIFNVMGIETTEVIEAASTKWNFIKLMPGLVGGHCIGVDPYYLTYKAEQLGYKPNLILGARQINNGMGNYIAEKTIKMMIDKGVRIKGSKVLILGFTFKENCPDIRNTKVIDVVNSLVDYGCHVDVSDYLADDEEVKKEFNVELVSEYDSNSYDAIIVAVAHDEYKGIKVGGFDQVIFDVKSILERSDDRL